MPWRSGQPTRVEALTDAVFGFAITLLVVSLEVPVTFEDLMATMRGFGAFACSFALLILVWYYHYRLFTRYPLDDGWTIFLNSVLLFVVLFYVYPLKFVFSSWLNPSHGDIFTAAEQVPLMMAIYGGGFVAVFAVFALLFRHAWKQRAQLRLTPEDAALAREEVLGCVIMIGVGALSIVLALTLPDAWAAALAGFIYFLIGPLQWLRGRSWTRGRRDRAIAAAG